MKGKLTTKTIVVIALTLVLIAVAITGTVLFLKDSGRAEAMSEENETDRLPVTGANQEQNNNEQETIYQENNADENMPIEENNETEQETETQESETNQLTQPTTGSTTVGNQSNPSVGTRFK